MDSVYQIYGITSCKKLFQVYLKYRHILSFWDIFKNKGIAKKNLKMFS